MSANVSALASEAKRKAIVARTLRLVGPQPPHARVARCARRKARPLPGLALGGAAAADDRPGGDALLSGFPRQMARVEDLGAATIEEVMSAFAGLGYYSRARNLHACAKEIVRRGGTFPSEEAELRALPGVGAYTAAAIAAIAFGRRTAPVDGNIARILARLLAVEKPIARARVQLAAAAHALAPSRRAGDFAQALMDIGATLCRPINPVCGSCPLACDCAAFQAGRPRGVPAPPGGENQAAPAGGCVLRPTLRRRLPRAPPAASWPSGFDHRVAWNAMDERKPRRGACRRSGRRALAEVAGRRGTGFHPFRAEADRLRCGIRRGRSSRLFLGQSRGRQRGGIFEHDAEGGHTRPDANVTRATRLYR